MQRTNSEYGSPYLATHHFPFPFSPFPIKRERKGKERKGKGKESGVWPSMVTHTRNLSSAFNPSKCTLTAVNTHPEQWAAMLRRPGSSWGIGALLKGLTSVVVLKVERALVIHSPHRQFLPDLGIKPATFGLQVQLSNHKATAAPVLLTI